MKMYKKIPMVLFTSLPYLISSLTYLSLNISTHPLFVRFLEAIFSIVFFIWYMKIVSNANKPNDHYLIVDFTIPELMTISKMIDVEIENPETEFNRVKYLRIIKGKLVKHLKQIHFYLNKY